MSQKKVKQYRKLVRRHRDQIVQDFVKEIKTSSLKDRLAIAWYIVRGK
jgi:hypothetical protein